MAKRFRAFISYSQRDKPFARRLHKAIETYRVPAGVRAESLDRRTRRVGRVFRDDDEMGASADLGASLRGALDDADALIVICSRRSAKSQWVNQEIAYFKKSGRADRIFAVIIDGAPNATRDADHCFAPALRFEVDASGAITSTPSEPLGLDTRVQPFERMRVRLIAGLLDIPFDDLWNRDRRRRQRNQALAAAAGAVTLGGLGIGGFLWNEDRERAQVQQIDRALIDARRDFGEGRVAQGLARLRPHLDGPHAARVEPALRAVLGWAPTIAEQVNAGSRPRLLSYRGALLFMGRQGRRHDLSELGVAPQRAVLANDQRRLVLTSAAKTLVVDVETGAILARHDNNDAEWGSHAFETLGGVVVLLGRLHASTMGGVAALALTVSADGRSVRATALSSFVHMRSVWLAGACDELIVASDSSAIGLALTPAGGVERAYASAASAPTASATEVWASGAGVNVFSDSPFSGDEQQLRNFNPFAEIGCSTVAADTAAGDIDPAVVETQLLGSLAASTASWNVLGQLPELARAAPARTDIDVPIWDDLPAPHRLSGVNFWRSPPTPRGVAPEVTDFDTVNGAQVSFFDARGNAYVRWVACSPGRACVEVTAVHNEGRSQELVRSPDGAYLLIAHAGALIDLSRMQIGADAGALPTDVGAAFDFEPDRAQLAMIDQGELVAYRPEPSGRWSRVGEIAPASLRRGEQSFSGLIALGRGEYVVARSDGGVMRVTAAGDAAWQITFGGLGRVVGLRYSADRRFAALIGQNGVRVFETETGLARSGVLRPPGWRTALSDVAECVGGIHVGDTGDVRVICMTFEDETPRSALWSPRLHEGEIMSRIEQLLCDADAGLSALAALERCADRF